jgi:hypothetical protein
MICKNNILQKNLAGLIPKPSKKEDQDKNPAAVALGQLGGKIGGKVRAESLTPERRKKNC